MYSSNCKYDDEDDEDDDDDNDEVTYSRTSRSWGSSLTGHTLKRQREVIKCVHL